MPRMKELLRKLRIGGGASISEHLNRNLASCSSASASPTSTIATDDKGVDFNHLEDDYQMQLAMAISASDSDSHKDPDSAQIDAAKQMSLGYAASGTDTEALVQFQSLRYWNYNVIDYEEKVMDGFYDVYGITSNKGKMPLLVDLQNKPISENVDCEVILVNRIDDFELKHLEEKACTLSNECCVSEKGLIFSGLPQKLANIVVNRMGGAVGSTDKLSRSWAMRSRELQDSLGTVVLPLGCLDVGLLHHRALLFKVLADRINIPCMLVKGSCYTGTDDGALNFLKADDGSEYIIDMMGSPGTLIPAEIPSSQLQNYSFAVRGCEEIVGLPNNTHLMLEDGPGVLGISSDLGRISTVNGAQSEGLFNRGDERIHVAIHETERFGHNLGGLLQSLHKSSECSSHTEASPAEKIRVKNVSKYVLSAAKNPEFAQKLHTVLLESGALPPSDLFSDVNPQDMGEEKASEKIVGDTVQTDPDRLLLRCEKSRISFQGVVSASDTRSCQSADWSAEQQEELHTDATRFYNSSQFDNIRKGSVTVCNRVDELEQSDAIIVDRVSVDPHTMHKEQCLEPSLPKAAVSCKRHNGFNLSCDDDENGFSNKVGAACSNTGFGENSVIQINETPNGDCILYDCKNEKVNPVLAESTEWEIQWEDLHIGARIGIGSCGEVYRADCNGTEVAVKKFLDQDFSGDALAQFKSEVEIMLRLRHPNIVLFMGAITRPPHLSILTEFLPRGSLYRLLHHPKFLLDEKRRLHMALDVAKGMNCLHTSHPPIVHRDLKSPNLLVDKHWVVKVSDFGLSRLKHHTFLSSKSSAGTPEWMAPEVLRNEPASEKCDVYSFGVILWELATRKIPWKGLNPMQVVGAVGFQNRWLEIPEDVDPEVAQIIHDCWQMEPQLRPSFSQLVSRLSRLHHLVVEKTSSTD